MSRHILDSAKIHPAIQETVASKNLDIVLEVQQAIASNKIVVVGMAQNPAPKRARKTLDALGAEHAYLEYGSYFFPVVQTQCSKDVDRLAIFSNDLCRRCFNRRQQ